jgi:CHAD domain-containing protein/HD superfamily phosphodiesterase
MPVPPKAAGLRYWMLRTLDECENAAHDFAADPVHDLRVSLRRCRSMADGLMAMDPDPAWKAMKKAGKKLFQSLGALRDVQVTMDWIEKLGLEQMHFDRPDVEQANVEDASVERALLPAPPEALPALSNPASPNESHHNPAHHLVHILNARETEHKHEARAALEEFDRKQWKEWSKSLPARAAHIRPGSAVYKHLALERFAAARQLHSTAMRNRSQVALHALRIGIKRFRYIVENFLPVEHKLWADDLKHMQDLLGEVHDLDVLWATALASRIFPDAASRKTWHERILKERNQRIDEYRQHTIGSNSLWEVWRAGLPQGKRIQEIATSRMKLWAKALDPDFSHSERVARFSLQLYDGLMKSGLLRPERPAHANNGAPFDARDSLYLAALLHDVGKSTGNKGHHKESRELIQKHGAPLGWKPETFSRAALVARFHCGVLPTRSHKALRDLLADEQKTVIRLAAILRLANALDADHTGQIHKVRIENNGNRVPHFSARALRREMGTLNSHRSKNGFLLKPQPPEKNEAVVIAAEGYTDNTPAAQTIAAERYLLETVLRRPIIVKPAQTSSASVSRRPASAAISA